MRLLAFLRKKWQTFQWPLISDTKRSVYYGVKYHDHNIPNHLAAGTVWGAWVRIQNTGNNSWRLHHKEGKRIDLIVLCGNVLVGTYCMPHSEVRPGDLVTIHFPLHVPSVIGLHEIQLDLVEQGVARFSENGVIPLEIGLYADSVSISPSCKLYEQAARINPWYYQPTQGIHKSVCGPPFPLFVSRAKGCHVWDLEDNQYIDYTMGWGSILLGYADTRIQNAISEALTSAGVLPFPHPVEMEVSEMLTEDIPCAEMVVFGKNGSDVCTLAARLARLFTGKTIILYSGYHGWQDFWVEQEGFAMSGVPDRPKRLIHRFKFNDLDDFLHFFDKYHGDIAAVMLEPSGPFESIQGPTQDASRDFLGAIASITRKTGALMIFDEIVTGYRYPTGSVQKAKGIIPDLTCLGKALGSGMPLSALVGRAHIFQRCMENTLYGPTFKGEVYSLAAAKAAIQIYRREPVAKYVWNYGTKLKNGINALCKKVNTPVQCLGPPFRMGMIFNDPNPERLRMKRTLYQQELLKAGVITYNGIMLPSYAHDERVMALTFDAVGNALEKISSAESKNTFHQHLEIPLL